MTNKKNSQKIQVSITLDKDVAEGIHIQSRETFRSFSQYINYILWKHIKKVSRKDNVRE